MCLVFTDLLWLQLKVLCCWWQVNKSRKNKVKNENHNTNADIKSRVKCNLEKYFWLPPKIWYFFLLLFLLIVVENSLANTVSQKQFHPKQSNPKQSQPKTVSAKNSLALISLPQNSLEWKQSELKTVLTKDSLDKNRHEKTVSTKTVSLKTVLIINQSLNKGLIFFSFLQKDVKIEFTFAEKYFCL